MMGMRHRSLLTVVVGLVAASLLMLTGCGDGDGDEAELDRLIDQISGPFMEGFRAICRCESDSDERAHCFEHAAEEPVPPCDRNVYHAFDDANLRGFLNCLIPPIRELNSCADRPDCSPADADVCRDRYHDARRACLVLFPFPAGFEDALEDCSLMTSDSTTSAKLSQRSSDPARPRTTLSF